jgi:uncharacterized protein YjeT (DUF2065 family)
MQVSLAPSFWVLSKIHYESCSFLTPNTANQAATEFLGGLSILPARVLRLIGRVQQNKGVVLVYLF